MGADKTLTSHIARKEQSYFSSLSNLASLYGFTPLNVSGKVYPLNIFLSHRHAKEMVSLKDAGIQLYIVETEEQNACLATVKTYDTCNTLYYLAIQPLFNLLKDKAKKKESQLLLSVCAYLYQVAHVPYYRDITSYTYYQYEMIEEMIIGDEGSYTLPEMKKMLRELAASKNQGDRLLSLLSQPRHLECFEKRLKDFCSDADVGNEIHRVASNAFQLYKNYPCCDIRSTIPEGLIQLGEEEQRIYPEQYISFIWNTDGWIYNSLEEYVNCELQEYAAIDEPAAIQYFDKPQEAVRLDLSFADKLFTLMDDVACLLNNHL